MGALSDDLLQSVRLRALHYSLIAFVWVVLALPLSGQVSGNVDVKSVVKVFVANDMPAHLVSYKYNFLGRQTVYIKGLGVVSSRGEFEYFTREPTLQILDAPDGAILAEVALKETVVVASGAPLNYVPSDGEFPAAFRSYAWTSSTPLQERLNGVLRKYFSYMPHDENKVNYISTTFTPLQIEKLARGTTAHVALLISFPHDATQGKYWFHVKSLVREGRVLSDSTRPTNNESIQRAASEFVDQLIKEIEVGVLDRP